MISPKRLLGFMLVGLRRSHWYVFRLYPLLTFPLLTPPKATVFVLSNIREKVISGIEKISQPFRGAKNN